MPDYKRTLTIEANPDELFEYLSKVENLPDYFSRMTDAHPITGDEVKVTAQVPEADGSDAHGEVEAYTSFEIDADNRALKWGLADWATRTEHTYHGELTVTPADTGATVEVTLHTEHDDDAINNGIDETLQNIASQVAAHPGLQA
jgi:ribosome-associated toxin RatA of RatAB toxin-antitoxin module